MSKNCHEAEESAQRDAELTIRRGESLADAEKRKPVWLTGRLSQRSDFRALNLLNEEPEDLRVKRYASWVYALGVNEGEITLAEGEEHLKEPLAAALGTGNFSFSKKAGNFSGGIMILHGRVVDNLTYDLVVRDHRPELTRYIFEMLSNDTAAEESDDA